MAAGLAAQERPARPSNRENRRENREREKPSAPAPETEQTPANSPAQGNDINESWMKELRSPQGNPSPEAKEGEAVAKPDAPAADGQPGALFAGEQAPSFLGLLLRFVLIAGIMGGSLYVFVRFVKKRTGIVNPHGGPAEVLATIPLMPGKFLQIVDVAGQLLVLGVSESGVRLVHVIDSSTTAERIRLWHQSRPKASASSLIDAIQNAVKKGEFRFWGGERAKDRPDFLEMLNGDRPGGDVPTERLSELLREQNRKIRRSTEPGAGSSVPPDSPGA